MRTCCTGVLLIVLLGFASHTEGSVTVYQDGGDRLVALQNNDGGWDWPLDDGVPTNASPRNTAAPIAMGLLAAYAQTGSATYLDAALDAGALLRDNSPPHSTGNGIFMDALSQVTGDSQYANDVRTEFYDELANGSYLRDGTSYDAAGYAQSILAARTGQSYNGVSYHNLATWDIALAAVGAHRLGANTAPFVSVLQTAIEGMEGDDYFDVIGLAGGVWALAEIGVDFDPTSGEYEAAGSLADLADILAGYQLGSGGFTWNSGYMVENDGNEAEQETAYAMLALNAFNRSTYQSELGGAANFLADVQLGTGGWGVYGENNEVTGEVLWALDASVPEPTTLLIWSLLGLIAATCYARRK